MIDKSFPLLRYNDTCRKHFIKHRKIPISDISLFIYLRYFYMSYMINMNVTIKDTNHIKNLELLNLTL